jgi:hypothetical protein
MDQDPIVPQNQGENSKPADVGIDLDKILLPKKEVHDPANAQRINAGALLAQEEGAALPKPERVPPPTPSAPPQEESLVKPIETFQGDIESVVQQKNVSVVSIAAAEAARRSSSSLSSAPQENTQTKPSGGSWRIFAMIMGGIFFLTVAVGVISIIYLRTRPVPPLQSSVPSPFISVDGTEVVALASEELTRPIVITELEDARRGSALPLGLIGRTFVAEASTTSDGEHYAPVHPQTLLSLLSSNIPSELTRTLTGEYLLGVHSFDDNQSFLIVGVDSYQQAFSGMLKWERFIKNDLAPLFTRTPRPRTPEELASTPNTATPQFLPTPFIDAVVENHDTRVVRDPNGDILLLWTFLDRNTLVITTNEYTLREILSRFVSSPNVVE